MSKQPTENILVVKREQLFQGATVTDFFALPSFESWEKIIKENQEFLPRNLMEEDETYKQIIPYLVYTHNNRYFLMERASTSSEQRLKSKKSLGIGGHIREEDLDEKNIIDWAQREFHEEVSFSGELTIKPLGIINDESNAVGKVHIGFVFLLTGDSDDISIKSELKSGTLLTLAECEEHYPNMERWSQLVFDYLKSNH